MKKYLKSQIGIFVVVAVIIVVLGILLFYLNSNSLNFFRDQDGTYQVKEFVETCLDIELKEAQRQLGLHGGWLYIPENKNIRFIDRKTQRELVEYGGGFDFFRVEIPYWYHYDNVLGGFDSQGFPSYDDDLPYSVKNQLKRYLDENLEPNCIQGFSSFDGVYDIKYDPDEIETIVELKNDEIVTELEFAVLVNDVVNNESDFFDFFENEQYNKIQVPYFIARDIVRAERESSFIEKRMMQFLGHKMERKSRDNLPPTYEFTVDDSPDFRPWIISDVEDKVKQVISSNIDLIQFYNTRTSQNYNLPDDLEDSDFANSFYSLYEKDYLSESSLVKESDSDLFERYENYRVDMNYETFYPISFKLSPSLGNVILMPEPQFYLGGLLPFITNEYQAIYEFTTPVLIEISDAENINDNFVFNLAIESNVAHNTPLRENYVIDDIDLSLEEKPVKSLVCNPSQFTSKHVNLNITDRIDFGDATGARSEPKVGVEGAFVTFNCKGFSTCYMGQTKINGPTTYNNITRLRFQLPTNCNPGTLEISKAGHKTLTFDNLDPNLEEEIYLGEVYMDSQKDFDLNLDIVSVSSDSSEYERPRGIRDEEEGFLIFTNLEDENIVQVINFNSENQNDLKIKLLPGNYSIKGFLMYEDDLNIPSKEICYTDGLSGAITGDEECVTIPEMNLDSWITGGVEFESFEIDYFKIITNDEITVRLIDFGIPRTFDEFSKSSQVMGEIAQKSKLFSPRFS